MNESKQPATSSAGQEAEQQGSCINEVVKAARHVIMQDKKQSNKVLSQHSRAGHRAHSEQQKTDVT
jgi:hypothetical protein